MQLTPDDPRLGLRGVADLIRDGRWWTPFRLPASNVPLLHPDLELRARMPAGARFVFRTDARRIEFDVMVDVPTIGSATVSPFDVLVNGSLALRQTIVGGRTIVVDNLPGTAELAEIELWLPHYGLPRLGAMRLDGTRVEPSTTGLPKWIAYGSSITQCRLSDGPSVTWPALVARDNGWDLRNLGMSGECHLDPSIARYIRDSDADLIQICIGINIYNAGTFNRRSLGPAVIGFLQTVMDGHPSTPVVVMTTIASPVRETTPNSVGLTLQDIRQIVRDSVAALDDARLVVVEGTDILGEADVSFLADTLHPSDAGYRLMAERLAPRLAVAAPTNRSTGDVGN